MKRTISLLLPIAALLLSLSAFADDSMKDNFMEACGSSPYIGEGSNCACIYNEVKFNFGKDDIPELLTFIDGSATMDKEVKDAIAFIAGKCED